jgi:drug/metabolite transporter (DMT)-like permease
VPRDRRFVALAVATGALDMVANVLFLAAARAGMLSLAALITSLYPVVVAGLAHGLLRERLDRLQWTAVGACLGAVGLIAIGG